MRRCTFIVKNTLWKAIIILVCYFILCDSGEIKYLVFGYEMVCMQREILKRSTEENYIAWEIDPIHQSNILEIHVNNYKDQRFVRDILSHCEPITDGPRLYKTSPYRIFLYIGDYKIIATVMPDFSMPRFYCELRGEYVRELYAFFATIPVVKPRDDGHMPSWYIIN